MTFTDDDYSTDLFGKPFLNRTVRVVVVDDHALLAESVVMTLRSIGIAAASARVDGTDLFESILDHRPDLVLLDLFLGNDPEPSFTIAKRLAAASIQVLIVTATSDRLLHARCVENGATAVIEKSRPIEALIDAVQRALRSEPMMSTSAKNDLLLELAAARRRERVQSKLSHLTPRERDVLHALTLGHAAGWIAREHSTSVLTVRTHIRAVLFKLEVHSQLEAVSLALREGWFR